MNYCAGSMMSSSSRLRMLTSLIRIYSALPVNPPRFHTCRSTLRNSEYDYDDSNESIEGQEPVSVLPQANKKRRQRLDEVCLLKYPQYSRNVIQSWIAQGKVLVNDRAVTKAGTPVPANSTVIITAEQPKYVCRAGLKLDAALDKFNIDVAGMTVLDSGLSTGGFTDCLLQRGALRVIGVDVGYGQVAEKIRTDRRVTVMERTNLRHLSLTDLDAARQLIVDLVTLDVSFISSLKMIEAVCDILKRDGGQLVLLIKPQFEAGKAEVSAGGVVRDPQVRAAVVERVVNGWKEVGFECMGWMESPIKGATSGNTEYLAHFIRNENEEERNNE